MLLCCVVLCCCCVEIEVTKASELVLQFLVLLQSPFFVLTSMICLTSWYYPQIIRKQAYGKVVDWWSLGTLLYEMLAGLPPYYDKNRQRMYQKIVRYDLSYLILLILHYIYHHCR